jgi:hypothetical protein
MRIESIPEILPDFSRSKTATEEVITILFTDGLFAADFNKPSVPWTAGLMKSLT